jgi:hypothetical protein
VDDRRVPWNEVAVRVIESHAVATRRAAR